MRSQIYEPEFDSDADHSRIRVSDKRRSLPGGQSLFRAVQFFYFVMLRHLRKVKAFRTTVAVWEA